MLQDMQERGVGLDDPVRHLRNAAKRSLAAAPADGGDDLDDVARISKRINWMNQFGGLSQRIKTDDVVGALYCLGAKPAMSILRSLQEKGVRVSDPTWYIKAAVQRANGIKVAPMPGTAAAKDEATSAIYEGDEEEQEEAGTTKAEGGWDEETEEVPVGTDGYEDAWEEDLPYENEEVAAAAYESAATASLGEPVLQAKTKATKSEPKERRVVGGLTGYSKLTPTRQTYGGTEGGSDVRWWEAAALPEGEDGVKTEGEGATPKPAIPEYTSKASRLPPTPQQKLVQCRDMALRHGLNLDALCLKSLARLPFHKAKDLIDETILGGKNRKGVNNPSRYLTIGCQKTVTGLGVEQGIAMELASGLGVVLNNDMLDELACIPRKDSQAIIRELAVNQEAAQDAQTYVMNAVMKRRAAMEARPFPPTG